MNNTNNATARQSFDQAKAMFYKAFLENFKGDEMACKRFVENLKLSQSEIRLETLLSATQTSFTFGVTPNQVNSANINFATENRLQMQDSLCVNEYGIYVAIPGSNTAVNYQLNTWGNPNTFSTANVADSINNQFYSNGFFRVKCNNDVLMPYRGLLNHWYKPQTQLTGVTGSATVADPADQIRGAEDGCITMEPNLVLIGSKNNVPTIELPGAMTAADATLRVVLIMRGILAQNSTVVS